MAKDTTFTATEIKAGALVLAAVAILVLFLVAIRGCWTDRGPRVTYYASFADIGGLDEGAGVRFGGVKVGRVTAIEPDPDNRTRIRIAMKVKEGVPINEDSVASIEQVTLTAERHLEISTGSAEAPLLDDGETLRSGGISGLVDIPDVEGVVVRLEQLLDDVTVLVGVDRIDAESGEVVGMAEVMARVDSTLEETSGVAREVRGLIVDNRSDLGEIVQRLVDVENAAAELMRTLDATVQENRQLVHQSAVNLERLTTEALAQLETTSADLDATMRHVRETGANASDLLDDQRPAIEEIIDNLRSATRNLRELSRTLTEQPQALIRGREVQGRHSGGSR